MVWEPELTIFFNIYNQANPTDTLSTGHTIDSRTLASPGEPLIFKIETSVDFLDWTDGCCQLKELLHIRATT